VIRSRDEARRGRKTPPGPPMTLANMRMNGVRAVIATCEACGHTADVNVDALPERVTVPEAGRGLRCSHLRRKADQYAARVAHGLSAALAPFRPPCA
jgi:hypothetical protein